MTVGSQSQATYWSVGSWVSSTLPGYGWIRLRKTRSRDQRLGRTLPSHHVSSHFDSSCFPWCSQIARMCALQVWYVCGISQQEEAATLALLWCMCCFSYLFCLATRLRCDHRLHSCCPPRAASIFPEKLTICVGSSVNYLLWPPSSKVFYSVIVLFFFLLIISWEGFFTSRMLAFFSLYVVNVDLSPFLIVSLSLFWVSFYVQCWILTCSTAVVLSFQPSYKETSLPINRMCLGCILIALQFRFFFFFNVLFFDLSKFLCWGMLKHPTSMIFIIINCSHPIYQLIWRVGVATWHHTDNLHLFWTLVRESVLLCSMPHSSVPKP